MSCSCSNTEINVLPPEIVAFIEECNAKEHSESYLIPVLQMVQETMGFLSTESMDEVSWRMKVPSAKVTGVATFYHFFTFKPRGEFRVTVCMGTACFVRGADKVLDRLKILLDIDEGDTTEDGKFSIDCARCIGACALAPVVLVNERVYGNVKLAEVEKILTDHGFDKAKGAKA
ncbi:MAG: NAD(P)H-dependent oxidoreductase subunit E [Verrucomicrobia bacterium]|jgi:NADP-reducing hydrogenase subunit HndA|nr:NAD(P)H-dependent oxidoreductase subunit E [Verrucomicrobiota bacterium]